MNQIVSVILPNFNHASYIGACIEAVLAQTYSDFELFIMDDCSSDDSQEVIEGFRKKDDRIISIYNETNHGVSYSRNRAIEKSKGEYVAFCDADDIWKKDKLRLQVESLEAGRDYDVCFTDAMIIDAQGRETGETFSGKYGKAWSTDGNLFWQLCETNFINNSSVMLRKNCVKEVGLLDERLRYLQDWLYWICLARHFRFLFLDMILVGYRVHARSSDHDKIGYSRERTLMGKEVIDRFPDLPPRVKSDLYYRLGNDYAYLAEKKSAYENYLASLRYNGVHLKSYARIMKLLFGRRPVSV